MPGLTVTIFPALPISNSLHKPHTPHSAFSLRSPLHIHRFSKRTKCIFHHSTPRPRPQHNTSPFFTVANKTTLSTTQEWGIECRDTSRKAKNRENTHVFEIKSGEMRTRSSHKNHARAQRQQGVKARNRVGERNKNQKSGHATIRRMSPLCQAT